MDYKHVLAYIASMRGVFGENVSFLCGYGHTGYILAGAMSVGSAGRLN